ncbi:FAD-binding protein [Massilia sp. Root351]|jgi:NADPH-dependent ferric siderophore reductase|uniref:siderophore-interacting protein n=1 Tax=Massilia sp. Root351 TaxID=1736522 RepID=UPI00070DE35B|nr:siderophore-interacting protein [Massilia sp. Root351]KQV88677.1 FAD-binding protein [Massilia sp. Root351]
MSIDSPVSRVQRVRHELKIRQAEVVSVRSIGSHFRAITFGGPALQDFHSASFDDHVKFILGDGPDAAKRDYTPRSFDPVAGELVIEFALHGDGPCAAWAAQAAPGQQVIIGGPRGSLIIPVDYAWHLLVGDETGLPAIARRLEELPRGARATVIVKVEDAADRRAFAGEAAPDVRWVDSDAQLLAAVQAWPLPAGDGYAWCAGEAATMAAVRHELVGVKGLGKHAIRAAAYWKRGGCGYHDNLE